VTSRAKIQNSGVDKIACPAADSEHHAIQSNDGPGCTQADFRQNKNECWAARRAHRTDAVKQETMSVELGAGLQEVIHPIIDEPRGVAHCAR
jgi:hypothetical protein